MHFFARQSYDEAQPARFFLNRNRTNIRRALNNAFGKTETVSKIFKVSGRRHHYGEGHGGVDDVDGCLDGKTAGDVRRVCIAERQARGCRWNVLRKACGTLSQWERVGPQGRGEGFESLRNCALHPTYPASLYPSPRRFASTLSPWERVAPIPPPPAAQSCACRWNAACPPPAIATDGLSAAPAPPSPCIPGSSSPSRRNPW